MFPRKEVFQSTLPPWGATSGESFFARECNISIPAPHIESNLVRDCACRRVAVSIHAPSVGSNSLAISASELEEDFNPRSLRGEQRKTASALSEGK